jgi:hypothetical protein
MDSISTSTLAVPTVTRGSYGEILHLHGMNADLIIKLFAPALPAVRFDRFSKRHTESLNLSLYGYDALQEVAIIQARQHSFDSKYGFSQTRKTYFLCGFNEITKLPFRHPVSAAALHGSLRKGGTPVDVVRAAQRWMWSCTAKQLEAGIRQGDVLLVRERGVPKEGTLRVAGAVVGESHQVRASAALVQGNRVYVAGVDVAGVEKTVLSILLPNARARIWTAAGDEWRNVEKLIRVSEIDIDGAAVGPETPGLGLVRIDEIRVVGKLFCETPTLLHTKCQHDQAWCDSEGWHSVRVARVEAAWDFAQRLGD